MEQKTLDCAEICNYISDILKENEIEPTREIFDKLTTYYDYLIEYNNAVNLTSITEMNDVFLKHFADCMLGVSIYKKNATICDIGTGAGFPGVVLKIVRPDLRLTLVDSLNKRVVFLQNLITKLDLKDVVVLHNRAEDRELKNKYLNSFDYVVARAVAQMVTLTEYCLPYVKVGGRFVAYKSQGAENEVEVATKCIKMLGGKHHETKKFTLANLYDRELVIIDKVSSTKALYPRDMNKPRLKPII